MEKRREASHSASLVTHPQLPVIHAPSGLDLVPGIFALVVPVRLMPVYLHAVQPFT